jgi:DNA replication and repair protein RecF
VITEEYMYIKSLDSLQLDLKPGINVFYGENGSGKTNIIEAVYWLGMIRSFRVSEDAILVKQGKENMQISAEVSDNDLDKLFSVEYSKDTRRKTIKENNSKLSRMSEMIGRVPLVLFSPENIMMIKGEPVLRRKFIDDLISQVNKEYYAVLSKYTKEVAHRNYLLKGIKEGKVKRDSLSIWNKQVAENGSRLVSARLAAIEAINKVLKDKLVESKTDVRLEYSAKNMPQPVQKDISSVMEEFFEKNVEEEIARNSTLIGPHRDDVDIFYKGQSAKLFASEGQQRITAILIKLAEGLVIRDKRGSYPVVLLDDFSSELDNPNRSFIGNTFRLFKQILITTTYRENLKGFEPAREFHVENGKVIQNS